MAILPSCLGIHSQHNVRVLPCAFFCFRRLPALLLSSAAVHALIDSLCLPTLPLTQVFPLFPLALLALISVTHCYLPPKILPPAPTPKLSTQSCVTVEISYLHDSGTRCILSLVEFPVPNFGTARLQRKICNRPSF